MKNVIKYFGILILGVFFLSNLIDKKSIETNFNFSNRLTYKTTDSTSYNIYANIPFLGKSFIGFKEALAFKESGGKYAVINDLGYLGKYQFGKSTLELLNVRNTQHFLNNPKVQEKAFISLLEFNKLLLKDEIKQNVGKIINGTEITESGILAAAHLAGAGNVKKYLDSKGKIRFSDTFGSSIREYLREFSGFDTSIVKTAQWPI